MLYESYADSIKKTELKHRNSEDELVIVLFKHYILFKWI